MRQKLFVNVCAYYAELVVRDFDSEQVDLAIATVGLGGKPLREKHIALAHLLAADPDLLADSNKIHWLEEAFGCDICHLFQNDGFHLSAIDYLSGATVLPRTDDVTTPVLQCA